MTILLFSPEDFKEEGKLVTTKRENNLLLIMDGIADLSQGLPSFEYVLFKWANGAEEGGRIKRKEGRN